MGADLNRSVVAAYRDTRKIAVLYFHNLADTEYDGFVEDIADMMMTRLGQSRKLKLIETVQIDRTVDNFKLELSEAIETETAV